MTQSHSANPVTSEHIGLMGFIWLRELRSCFNPYNMSMCTRGHSTTYRKVNHMQVTRGSSLKRSDTVLTGKNARVLGTCLLEFQAIRPAQLATHEQHIIGDSLSECTTPFLFLAPAKFSSKIKSHQRQKIVIFQH